MWIFAAAVAMIAQAGEWLAVPTEGLVAVDAQTTDAGSIERWIPSDERADGWLHMVTLLTLDQPAEPDAYSYLAQSNRSTGKRCPGFRAMPPTDSRMGGVPAVDGFYYCPNHPDRGQPITAFQRVAAANGRLYMVQITMVGMPDADKTRWAMARIEGARVCPPQSTKPPCVRVVIQPR